MKIESACDGVDIDNFACKIFWEKEYAFVALNPIFKKVSEAYYGKHSDGLVASNTTGATLLMDGTHWNDNGAALVADAILPMFDFL